MERFWTEIPTAPCTPCAPAVPLPEEPGALMSLEARQFIGAIVSCFPATPVAQQTGPDRRRGGTRP